MIASAARWLTKLILRCTVRLAFANFRDECDRWGPISERFGDWESRQLYRNAARSVDQSGAEIREWIARRELGIGFGLSLSRRLGAQTRGLRTLRRSLT